MSGICGIFNLDGRPADPELIHRMTAAIAHRGPDGIHHVIDGPVALGHCMLCTTPESLHETQPLWDETKQYCLTLDGRVDNREELTRDLKSAGAILRDDTDAELVLKAYITWGDMSPRKLSGDFAYLIWDQVSRSLYTARDVFGLRTLYYAPVGESVLFASEIKALLANPSVTRAPNEEALARFFSGLCSVDPTETFFKSILAFPPAACGRYARGALRNCSYWNAEEVPEVRFRNPADYGDRFREVFTSAVRRRIRSAHPVALSVSGGLDSSAIFCMADSISTQNPAPPLLGFSYSLSDGSLMDERAYIERLIPTSGNRIMQFPMLVGLGSNLIPHATATETPDVDFTQLNTNAMHTAIGESGARVLLTGDWGDDVLFDQSYLVDMLSDLRPREVLNHLRAMPSWFADAEKRGFRRRFIRDLASNYLPENARTAVAFVRGSLHRRPRTATLGVRRPVRGQCAIRPRFQAYRRSMLQLFDPLLTRTRIERESKRASGRSLELALPYLDKELVSFMVGIPGEVQNSGAIPKGLLRVALADVMPPEITFRKWKADSTNVVLSGIRKDGYQHLERAASGPIVSHGYVQRSRVLKASGDTANVSPSDFLRFVGTDSWMRAYAL